MGLGCRGKSEPSSRLTGDTQKNLPAPAGTVPAFPPLTKLSWGASTPPATALLKCAPPTPHPQCFDGEAEDGRAGMAREPRGRRAGGRAGGPAASSARPACPSPSLQGSGGSGGWGRGDGADRFCKQSRSGPQPRTGCPGPAWV